MFGYLSSATEWMQRKAVHLLLRKKLGEFFEDQFDLDQIQVQLRQHEQHGDLTWQAAVSHVKVSTAAIAKHLVRAFSAPLCQPSSHQLYLPTCQMYMVTQLARPGWWVQPQSASTLVSFFHRQLSMAHAFDKRSTLVVASQHGICVRPWPISSGSLLAGSVSRASCEAAYRGTAAAYIIRVSAIDVSPGVASRHLLSVRRSCSGFTIPV